MTPPRAANAPAMHEADDPDDALLPLFDAERLADAIEHEILSTASIARTGKVLWSQKLGSGIISAPMTYRAPDGHQYVAVMTGIGGGAMTIKALPGFPARGSTMYVFALDGVPKAVPETPQQGLQSKSASDAGNKNKGKH